MTTRAVIPREAPQEASTRARSGADCCPDASTDDQANQGMLTAL
jgi:hypothetical protein